MASRLKIGMVCYPTFGGSGVVATELGKALAEKGDRVHFITYSQPSRLGFLNENLFYHEVRISAYPLFDFPPYELALASRIVNVVKHEKLNLLHVHYAIPHAAAAYMAKQILREQGISIPVVTTLHGTDITLVGKDPSYKPVVRFSINRSDGVTAVSKDLKDRTIEFFEVSREIEVIPNFIDMKKVASFGESNFKKAICARGEALIVHISNFRKVKRIGDVIRVFGVIRKKIPAKLVMVGDGPERQEAENACRALGLCDDIRFLGKLGAIEQALSIADLFLMPSEQESFGLAGLEAMAFGVPLISSDVGGLPELNKHGVSGFLSPVGDVEGMARHALRALDSDNLPALREGARRQAAKFDIANVLPLYRNYYQKALADRGE